MKSVGLAVATALVAVGEAAAVNVDVGRQLFVDDCLVEKTTLKRVWHHPVKYGGNPVMKPETPWEVNAGGNSTVRPNGGGMWWDAKEGVFKLWYEGGWLHTVCYATSKDGLKWERPQLDVVEGTNIVLPTNNPAYRPDSWTVVRDPDAKKPDELYKLMLHRPWAHEGYVPDGICAVSGDGIHWRTLYPLPPSGDRSSMYCDPFRGKWVYSIRSNWGKDARRNRRYFESDDFLRAPEWYLEGAYYEGNWCGKLTPEEWLEASPDDCVTAKESDFKVCQLYNFDAVSYESVMLGLFEVHQGPENDKCELAGMPKITEIKFGFSRDGRNFVRSDYTAAIGCEGWDSGKWDAGYVQPLANACVVQGDELWFYYGAFAGEPKRKNTKEKRHDWTVDSGMYANGAMGLAKLRRDGFASYEGTGELLTKPLEFSGDYLFVNADAKAGAIAVDLVDEKGNVVRGFSAADSRIEKFDSTKRRIVWKDRDRLDVMRTEGFRSLGYRLRFHLTDAALYSFWISRAPTGESNGYLAGGGPGYAGVRDTPPEIREELPHLIRPDLAHAKATRRHEGIPSMAVSPKGRMWVVWYAGPTPGEDSNNYLVLTSSTDGGKTWKEEWILDPDFAGPRRVFDSELWLAPDGKIRWTWTDKRGPCQADADFDQLWMATLDPETGTVVEQPRRIASGVMMNKPTVLKDGTWIFPIAQWWRKESSGCWASTDGGRTFVKRGGVTIPYGQRGYDEHTILERRDGTLVCYTRTFSDPHNCLWQAESRDGGRTWGDPRPAPVGNLSSRTFVTKLRDGRWMMVKHGGYGRVYATRKNLTALISEDEGRTWWGGLLIDGRDGCSYPDGQQLPDGSVAVVSDFDRLGAREISFARIDPDDIVPGRAQVERRIVSCSDARFISRTMGKLARSTAEHPAEVRILFYGQSITDQKWYRLAVETLQRRYPTAKLDVYNRAIGGFTSDLLIRTAEADLYPLYPDIVFLHDYGPTELVRKIVERIRARTTAEIVMWTSHVCSSEDPAALRKDYDRRSKDLIRIAADNHCLLVDLRGKWLRMLEETGKKPGDYLADGVHMKEETGAFRAYADFITEDLAYVPYAPDPMCGTITECAFSTNFTFAGNRVEAVFGDDRNFWKASPTRAFLDGRDMRSMKELFYHDRASSIVSWMPMLLHVGADALPVEEDWTLTFLEGTEREGKPVRYRVDGSVTGFDGEGTSTNDFRSKSGRVTIAAKDFHIWQFKYFGTDDHHPELNAHPGQRTFWTTRKTFTDRFDSYHRRGEKRLVVSGCANGEHTLTFVPAIAGRPPQIEKFIVYRPYGTEDAQQK